jgi:hypothetical protein
MWKRLAVATALGVALSGAAASAHHSVGINFDNTKQFDLTGVIKKLDIRNPHSHVTLTVTDDKGQQADWLIEWSDRNALIRRKVGFEKMRPGDTVTIRVSPSKRLEHVGYFQRATLADHTVLRDCGAPALTKAITSGEDVDCPAVDPQ